jgi:hypothetical protein
MSTAEQEDPDILAEEEKLARLLDKKAKLKFEEKRQQELQRYQQQTGKPVEFKLQSLTETKSPTNFGSVAPSTNQTSSPPPQQQQQQGGGEEQQNEYLKWREEQRRKEAEEKARQEEEERLRKERARQLAEQGGSFGKDSQSNVTSGSSSNTNYYKSPAGGFTGPTTYKPPPSFVPTSSFNKPASNNNSRPASLYARSTSGSNWKEIREQKEREERMRKEEDERKRREKLAELTNSIQPNSARPQSMNLTWKEQQALKEQQERARQEEEERIRQEKVREVMQGSTELSEYERRKREEEEQKRRELSELEQARYESSKSLVACKSCGQMVDVNLARDIRGNFYCNLCAPRALIGATGNCTACNRPLGMSIAKAAGKKYHPDCLICYACKKNIQGGFRQVYGQLWCVDCTPFNPSS